jgi:hypothetical protein
MLEGVEHRVWIAQTCSSWKAVRSAVTPEGVEHMSKKTCPVTNWCMQGRDAGRR